VLSGQHWEYFYVLTIFQVYGHTVVVFEFLKFEKFLDLTFTNQQDKYNIFGSVLATFLRGKRFHNTTIFFKIVFSTLLVSEKVAGNLIALLIASFNSFQNMPSSNFFWNSVRFKLLGVTTDNGVKFYVFKRILK
jgi:hypothetical protein